MKKNVLFFAYRFSFMTPGFDEPSLSLREVGGEQAAFDTGIRPEAGVL